MTDAKIIELALVLHDRSSMMPWEETANPQIFQSTLSNAVVRIKMGPSRETQGEVDYEIAIVNSNGMIIESFDDAALNRMVKNYSQYEEVRGYSVMAEIYQTAKRKALGVDKTLDDVLKELKDMPPF
jgi:hypothetical protein